MPRLKASPAKRRQRRIRPTVWNVEFSTKLIKKICFCNSHLIPAIPSLSPASCGGHSSDTPAVFLLRSKVRIYSPCKIKWLPCWSNRRTRWPTRNRRPGRGLRSRPTLSFCRHFFQDKTPIGSSNRRPRRVHSPPGAPGAPGVAREDEDPEELPAAPVVVDNGAGAVVALFHHKRKMNKNYIQFIKRFYGCFSNIIETALQERWCYSFICSFFCLWPSPDHGTVKVVAMTTLSI